MDNSTTAVNAAIAEEMLVTYLRSNLVPFIRSSPGMGKSSIINKVADRFNLELVDVRLSQCENTDLNGFPSINAERTRARYVPMGLFPLAGDPIPEGKEGFLLSLDEFTSTDRSVQRAAYKLALDRKVGEFSLHPKCAVICAGNLDTDNAIVEDMSTALQSRLVHLTLLCDKDTWVNWAAQNDIHPMIIAFIEFSPNSLHTFNPENYGTEATYGCPRTYEFLNRAFEHIDFESPSAVPLVSGIIGEGNAREFIAFLRMAKDVPSLANVIAHPDTAQLPSAPATQFAIASALAYNADSANLGAIMIYLERLPLEFQVIALKSITARDATMKRAKEIITWYTTHGADLF